MFVNGRYAGPMFQQADPTPSPAPSPAPTPNPDPPKPALREQLTDDQRKELDSQIAAARRQAEADARTKLEADAEKAKADAEAEAARKKQIEEGQFNEVKASLEGERDTFKSQAETEKGRADRAIGLLKAQIDERVKALPTSIADQFPKDADVLEQIEWLEDPRTKAVIDAAVNPGIRPTNPLAPRPLGGSGEQRTLEDRKKELGKDPRYSI